MATKVAKEAWVTGHSGSSPLEVLLVTLVPPLVGYDLLLLLAPPPPLQPLAELLLLHLPCVLCQCSDFVAANVPGLPPPLLQSIQSIQSIAAIHPGAPPIVPLLLLLLLLYLPARLLLSRPPSPPPPFPARPLVDMYRGSVSLLTFVAILAVDFRDFPRRYCKTEEEG